MEQLARKYAELKGTKIIASHMNDDGTITFVLESGPKMRMSAELLKDAISALERSQPAAGFEHIEAAVREETGSDAPASPSLSAAGGDAPEPPQPKAKKGKKQ